MSALGICIVLLMLMGSVVFSCSANSVLCSAGSGEKRGHAVSSGLRMRSFVCDHVCISCRKAFAMFMSLCVDIIVMLLHMS